MTAKIPVLMYHALEDAEHPAGAKNPGEQLYVLQVKQFREQMEFLRQEGFQTILLDELISMPLWPKKAIALTFDDGHESNYTLALPILQEFGFKAEFFITTGWIGTNHFLTPNQILKLHKAGMGIGSHSVSHPYLNDLSNREIENELIKSKTTLEGIINDEVTGFSAPGGRVKKPTILTIPGEFGYKSLYTSKPGIFKKGGSTLSIPRFAIKENTSKKDFSNIVNLTFSTLAKINIKNTFLYCLKILLGNKGYEFLRKHVLASK